jgi:hypothetical protein
MLEVHPDAEAARADMSDRRSDASMRASGLAAKPEAVIAGRRKQQV